MPNDPQPAPNPTPTPATETPPAPSQETPPPTPTPNPPETPPAGTSTTSETETTPETTVVLGAENLPLPEGFDPEDPLAGKFYETINEAGLSADQAQKLVPLITEFRDSLDAQAEELWLRTNEEWQQALIQEHGGEDALDAKLNKVAGLIDAYSNDMTSKFKANNPGKEVPDFKGTLKQALDLTGGGNSPPIANLLIWLSDQYGEGTPLTGSPPQTERSRADIMYGGGS